MKTTVNFYQFRALFREIRPGNFSSDGLACLFDYLEQMEEDMGEEMELDVIAICCDYSEDKWEDIADNYGIDLSDCEDEEAKIEEVKSYLLDEGAFVGEGADGCYVYHNI